MNVKKEICAYIEGNENIGALLLTGRWGCGKSYLIKDLARQLNDEKKAAVAVISLFGLDSVSAINKRVKDEYSYFRLGFLGKKVKKVSRKIAIIAKDSLAVATVATDGVPAISAAAQGFSSLMNYDLLSFEVKRTVGKNEEERKFVIVFDDLERSNLNKKDLLGTINEYVENKQVKVIIVADEKKIEANEYKEYREKLISRTISMTIDSDVLIDSIVKNYTETEEGYKNFLQDNIGLLKQVFSESQSDNLRTFKCVLADFERIYRAWKNENLALDKMNWALYSFAAELFISKAQKKENEEKEKNNFLSSFQEKKVQFPYKEKMNSDFSSFYLWIYKGEWDEDDFIDELKRKFEKKRENPLDRFLAYNCYDLQQEDIDEGLPAAIELAFKGELCCDDLISLLTKISFLKNNGIDLKCEINYQKIEEGFDKRYERIKSKELEEPKRHKFAPEDQLEKEAIRINKKIEKFDHRLSCLNNRDLLISYLKGDSDISQYNLRNKYIEEFDDELLDVFQKSYLSSSNSDKHEYDSLLLDLVFNDNSFSTEENVQKTKDNFKKLVVWLRNLKSKDKISNLINNKFADNLEAHMIMKQS